MENGAHYKQAKEFSESILRGDVEVKHTEDGAGAGETHRFKKTGGFGPLYLAYNKCLMQIVSRPYLMASNRPTARLKSTEQARRQITR